MTAVTPPPADAEADKAPKRPRSRYSAQAGAAWQWWNAMQPQKRENGTTPGDRATLARLRRCSHPAELAVEPATAELFGKLKFDRSTATEGDIATAAVLAGVLSHIRTLSSGSLARTMGARQGERAIVSAIRMKRFMAAREPEDVLRQFQRILAMLGDTADVRDVAASVLAWLDPSPAGDRARTRFAFAYHGATLEGADDLEADETSSAVTSPEA